MGILFLVGVITGLSIYFWGNTVVLFSWLQQAKLPLFLWRLGIYGIVAGMWLHRVRKTLLQQVTAPMAIYRLEVQMISLLLLIEFTCYRWGM
ncbi:putative membrane protein [Yersinia rochesterensis]|uniref:Membrane protein n=1 Tax=Yersinia rochesterensis TaxID=1604335 RepID=A0ABM5SIV4_9GAMM|nr:hypothetical protein [Yersinia rochesterensis]AJI86192.1 putative membrane protein [Yersinia frederiksenii Y225]AJJ34302.1 putative membrane protein [Yersinia rochesterensis]